MKVFRTLPRAGIDVGLLLAAGGSWAAALDADPFATGTGFNIGQFLSDLVPDRLDQNTVTAGGDTRVPPSAQPGLVAGKFQYATIRQRTDRTFGYGLQHFQGATRMSTSWLHTPRAYLGTPVIAALLAVAFWTSSAMADHGFDPNYSPNYVLDAFSSEGGNADRQGGKLVALPDGDIVVAGRMRLNNDALPFWNIGLVRYDRNGMRATWPGGHGGGPHFWQGGQYVVYPNIPNGGFGDTRIESVNDIAYADGRIYVLATRTFTTAPFDRDVVVYAFDEDGRFRQSLVVIGSGVDEIGRAIDVKVTNIIARPYAITVLAERSFQRMVVAKVDENQAGNLQVDAGFNGGIPLQVSVAVSCAGTPQCNVIPTDLARPERLFAGDGMPIYIAGAVQRAGGDWDYLAIKLNADGSAASDFGFGGLRYIPFNQPGSGTGDYATTLRVESSSGPFASDTLWLAGNVQRSCKSGIGVVKLDGDGDDDPFFGVDGRAVYGGSVETGTICDQEPSHFASDITLQGTEIAIAGDTAILDQGGQTLVDGALLRVDADIGSQRGLATLPLTFGGGGRAGASRLRGIVNDGGGRYTVSGEGDVMLFYSTLFISARTWPSDTIFSDEFDRLREQMAPIDSLPSPAGEGK